MSRLSPIDASFLHLESAGAHMNVGWSALGTVPAGVPRPTIEALRARVSSRLRYVPRCRQRVQFHPLRIGEPRWVDDESFDLDRHVVALEEPLSLRRFGQLHDALLSTPLDRSRPLWQIVLAPRLEDGRVGVVGRVHHAMADGAAALQIAALSLDGDDEDEDAPPVMKPWRAVPPPGIMVRTVDPLLSVAEFTARGIGDVARAALRPRASAVRILRDTRRVVGALSEDLIPRAPDSQLNVTPGPRRTLISHREPLADLRGAGPGTLNDVALTLVAGALRSLALECGRPAQPLKALVPVDVRQPHELGTLGNHVSLAAVWLPLNLSSPAARLAHIRAATGRFKRANRPAGTSTVVAALGLLPSGLRGAMLRAASPGAFNLSVSIIPGSRNPLYMLGARLDEIYPVIPVIESQALSIGMLRYHRHLHFGLHANPDTLPEAARLPELLAEEVRALTGGRHRTSRAPPRHPSRRTT